MRLMAVGPPGRESHTDMLSEYDPSQKLASHLTLRPSTLWTSSPRCPDLLDRVTSRCLERVTITKRGKVVAMLLPLIWVYARLSRDAGGSRSERVNSRGSIRVRRRRASRISGTTATVLLDPHAVILLVNGGQLTAAATEATVRTGPVGVGVVRC